MLRLLETELGHATRQALAGDLEGVGHGVEVPVQALDAVAAEAWREAGVPAAEIHTALLQQSASEPCSHRSNAFL